MTSPSTGSDVASGEDSGQESETRTRILNAAIECFSQFGNDKTTLSDVARVAGFARPTLYRYFPDRRALLEAVDAYEQEQMRAEALTIAEAADDFEEFLTGLVASQAARSNRYHTRQHLLAQDRGLFQSLFLAQSSAVERLAALLAPQLQAAADRGELLPDVDIAQAAEWIAVVLAGVSRLSQATTFDLDDPDDVGRFVARHLCHGIVAPSDPPAPRDRPPRSPRRR